MGGFKDHFTSVAGNYAEFRPNYPEELFRWIASESPGRERAWDCATGSGQAAVLLKPHFDEVIATDASAGQIANARAVPGIRYAVAAAEDSRLPEKSVDLITVAQAAHWFDLPRFYSEAERVLRKNGVLMLCCYGHFRFGISALDDAVSRFYNEIVGPYWPPERRFIEEDYRTLEFPLNEFRPAETFHMQAQFTLPRLAGYLRTWSATQRFQKAKGFDPVIELEKELAEHWPREKASGVLATETWPIHIRAGRFE